MRPLPVTNSVKSRRRGAGFRLPVIGLSRHAASADNPLILLGQRRQLVGWYSGQSAQSAYQFAFHRFIQTVERQVNAVIGHTALRKL